jgi:hypothetical protein
MASKVVNGAQFKISQISQICCFHIASNIKYISSSNGRIQAGRGQPQIVIKAIGNNEERKEITARRHKILTWKTLSNKER